MKKATGATRAGVMGRWSLFRPKVNDAAHRYQGFVTDIGQARFEDARERLLDLARSVLKESAPSAISDADTFEFLARGTADTLRELRKMKKEIDAA